MDGHGISLSRTVSNKALLHPCVPYYPLRAMEHHFLAKCCLAFFGGDAKSLAWVFLARRVCLFWGRCQIPRLDRLGVSCSSGCLSCFFFCLFWGRCQIPRLDRLGVSFVLPFVLGFFCCLFFGAMPNPSLGCFLLVGCCLSWLFFLLFSLLNGPRVFLY